MEQRPRQFPGASLDEPHLPGEWTEFGVSRPATPPEPLPRIPHRVEAHTANQRRESLSRRRLRIDQVAGDDQMRVERFARDEEAHDLARSLEDPVDPEVSRHSL